MNTWCNVDLNVSHRPKIVSYQSVFRNYLHRAKQTLFNKTLFSYLRDLNRFLHLSQKKKKNDSILIENLNPEK